MPQAVYLTKARAQQAISLAEPTINKLFDTVTNHKSLHLVVLANDGTILYETDLGPDAGKDPERTARTTLVSHGKAALHFRTGKPSLEVQARRPHILEVGDTIWGGSADYEGIIVAASGVQSCFDEAICAIVAAILWGLCSDAQTQHMAKTDKTPLYKSPL
ncbi:MAG TPA: hypothetical protein VGN88_12480 [Phycisphaerae bacterium]|jgi:hypothetical protein